MRFELTGLKVGWRTEQHGRTGVHCLFVNCTRFGLGVWKEAFTTCINFSFDPDLLSMGFLLFEGFLHGWWYRSCLCVTLLQKNSGGSLLVYN